MTPYSELERRHRRARQIGTAIGIILAGALLALGAWAIAVVVAIIAP